MNDRSLSVYVKKWIIVLTVNKSNFTNFTWFVYTFVNCKYNVLLKRDDVCLIPLSTLVTLSRFDEGKEIRIVCSKMLNVVATMQQRCGNVLITSESDVVTMSETDVGTTLIFDWVTTWLNIRKKSICLSVSGNNDEKEKINTNKTRKVMTKLFQTHNTIDIAIRRNFLFYCNICIILWTLGI